MFFVFYDQTEMAHRALDEIINPSTLRFSDYMEKDGEKNIFKGNLKENQRDALGSVLSDNNINMIVTPNDVDVISNQASDIIAEGINRALHPEK